MATIWEKVGKVLDGFGLLEKLLHEKPAEDALRNEFGHLRLQFHTEDKGDAGVIFTTFTRDDGTVRILSNLNGYWKRGSDSDDWVSSAHIQDPLHDNDPDTLFEVVTGDGFIALRNLGNKKFCKRLDADGNISQCARLEVEEPVEKCEIYDEKYSLRSELLVSKMDVSRTKIRLGASISTTSNSERREYHLEEARIYNKQILNVATDYSTNDTGKEMKAKFSFVKKIEEPAGAKISFGTGGEKPPIIVGGEVTFSYESSSSHETTVTQEYDIPPKTAIAAKLKRVRLTTGKEVTSTHHDGIYTVANNYNFGIVFTDNKEEVDREVRGSVLFNRALVMLSTQLGFLSFTYVV
ncbi:hypothetical protein VPH35_113530 [Triticum aestivum]